MLHAAAAMARRRAAGDGHPVLVFPACSRVTCRPVRCKLSPEPGLCGARLGSGRNLGLRPGVEQAMMERIEELHAQYGGRKLSLVGWSLGGIYARQLAKRVPDKVRSVISPAARSPAARRRPTPGASTNSPPASVSRIATITSRAPSPIRRPCRPPRSSAAPMASAPGRPASTRSAIRSRISRSTACHCGLGHHPAAVYAVADRLAQPEGQWKKFDRSGWKSMVYPDWRRR